MDLAKAGGAASTGAVRVLLEYGTRYDAELAASCRGDVLAVYCDKLLAAKEKPGTATLGAYRRLIATLTQEEVAGKVRKEDRKEGGVF